MANIIVTRTLWAVFLSLLFIGTALSLIPMQWCCVILGLWLCFTSMTDTCTNSSRTSSFVRLTSMTASSMGVLCTSICNPESCPSAEEPRHQNDRGLFPHKTHAAWIGLQIMVFVGTSHILVLAISCFVHHGPATRHYSHKTGFHNGSVAAMHVWMESQLSGPA